mgnify:CR=1 FL=1
MKKQTVREREVAGRRILVRVDFNVPLDKARGKVNSDQRLLAVLPTINYLIEQGAKVILCSHLGRPGGKVVEELRLAPVAQRLSELLGKRVIYVRDCIGPEVEREVAQLREGDILLLENLRFHPGEENNDPEFARALANLAELFVNDALSVSHRAHASTVGVTHYLPAVAGFLMEKELDYLGRVLTIPARPFAVLIGGAKVADKIGLLERISQKVDVLLIGGGMANTFLKAQGWEVGNSRVEEDKLDFARHLLQEVSDNDGQLLLPSDVVVARGLDSGEVRTVRVGEVPPGWQILDIGPQTVQQFAKELKRCKLILWNGPMGVFEHPPFARGTWALAEILAGVEATTIVCGGDSAAALEKLGLTSQMSFVSMGGGASLRFLEGATLPGVAALLDREPE